MKFIICGLILFPSLCRGFDILGAKNHQELLKAQDEHYRKLRINSKCEYFRNKGLLEWPCFLLNDLNYSQNRKEQICQMQLRSLTDRAQFPNEKEMLFLPRVCQVKLREKLRILDYKENES